MPFSPSVGYRFDFQEREYVVPAARPGSDIPHEVEGGKATITRVQRTDDRSFWALKEFRHRYRVPDQQATAQKLESVKHLAGMQAAHQLVITPDDPLAQRHSDLCWAILMPWVPGDTWGEVLGNVQAGKRSYTPHEAVILVYRLLFVLERLEREKIVHCDLSVGNVLIPTEKRFGAELVDLEDMYIRGQAVSSYTPGTPGYALPGVETTACAEGDRYAAAILICEALSLAMPSAKEHITNEGVFKGSRNNPKAQLAFESIHFELINWQPRFAELLKRAWFAKSLSECAPLSALMESILFDTSPIILHGALVKSDLIPLNELFKQMGRHLSGSVDKPFSWLSASINRLHNQISKMANQGKPTPPGVVVKQEERSESRFK